MDLLSLLYFVLLYGGLFLLVVGAFLIFVPSILVKWNALGNIWFGKPESAKRYASANKRFFDANYSLFARHRTTGLIMLAMALVFLLVYNLYR